MSIHRIFPPNGILHQTGVNVSLASSTLSVTEGDSGENTSVSVCLKLNDIHDGLQRDVHFHLTIVAHILACTLK